MSIKVDLTKPLNEEQIEYLKARGTWGERQLKENEALLKEQGFYAEKRASASAPTPNEMSDQEKADLLTEARDWIANAKVPELKERLAAENLSTDGKQDELRQRLVDMVEARYS